MNRNKRNGQLDGEESDTVPDDFCFFPPSRFVSLSAASLRGESRNQQDRRHFEMGLLLLLPPHSECFWSTPHLKL